MDPVNGHLVRNGCPVMCDACIVVDDKIKADAPTSRCAGTVDAPECATIAAENCGKIQFGTNISTFCPLLCLCGGIAEDTVGDGAEDDDATAESSSVVVIAASAAAAAVLILAIIIVCLMLRKKDGKGKGAGGSEGQLTTTGVNSGTKSGGNDDGRAVENPLYAGPAADVVGGDGNGNGADGDGSRVVANALYMSQPPSL